MLASACFRSEAPDSRHFSAAQEKRACVFSGERFVFLLPESLLFARFLLRQQDFHKHDEGSKTQLFHVVQTLVCVVVTQFRGGRYG